MTDDSKHNQIFEKWRAFLNEYENVKLRNEPEGLTPNYRRTSRLEPHDGPTKNPGLGDFFKGLFGDPATSKNPVMQSMSDLTSDVREELETCAKQYMDEKPCKRSSEPWKLQGKLLEFFKEQIKKLNNEAAEEHDSGDAADPNFKQIEDKAIKYESRYREFLQKAKEAQKEKPTIQSPTNTADVVVSGNQTDRANALWPMVKSLAVDAGVDPKLVMGVIHSENRFQNLSNNWGSGYMALTSIARKDVSQRGGVEINYKNRMNPELNIKAGIALLKLVEKDLRRALRRVNFKVPESEIPRLILYSYNRGVGAVVDGKGVPIGSPGKGKKYKHAGSKVFERGLKKFSDIDSFISYARERYSKVLHGDYADRALGFAKSYTPPGEDIQTVAGSKTLKTRKKI